MLSRPFAKFLRGLTAHRHHRDLWKTARRLSPLDLRRDPDDLELCADPDDLIENEAEPARFLGYYSEAGVDRALRAYGLVERIARRGFGDIRVALTKEDAYTSTLRVFGRPDGDRPDGDRPDGDRPDGKTGGPSDANWTEHGDVLLSENRSRLICLHPPEWIPERAARGLPHPMRVVRLEWLLLQNPLGHFTEDRPPLPGQRYPGLGLGREVMEVLLILGWRLRVKAFLINPLYVHNAILYSRKFVFLNPKDQAFYLALIEASGDRPLQQIALAVDHGFLHDARTDAPVEWPAAPQVAPLARSVIRIYRSPLYTNAVFRHLPDVHLRFDWEGYDRVHEELAARLPEDDDAATKTREMP